MEGTVLKIKKILLESIIEIKKRWNYYGTFMLTGWFN